MKSIIHRGEVTSLLLVTLRAAVYEGQTFPIGDAGAPEPDENDAYHAGWNGQPNDPGSVYQPYAVLTPSTASISSGSFSDPQSAWQLPYSLAVFGMTRGQVEALANVMRKGLLGLTKSLQEFDGDTYRVQQIQFSVLGGVGRVDQTNPSTYGEVDTFTVWLSQ